MAPSPGVREVPPGLGAIRRPARAHRRGIRQGTTRPRRIPRANGLLSLPTVHPKGIQRLHVGPVPVLRRTLAIVDRLARSKKYLLATINNESTELNVYRINRFNLRNYFTVFFSSCFLGVKKPEEAIYRLALEMTQRASSECLFIDDRELNVECARNCTGMRAIHYQDPAQLERELRAMNIEV